MFERKCHFKIVDQDFDLEDLEFELIDFGAEEVFKDGKKIGIVTSAVFSPDYKGNIGFAMIEASNATAGTEVSVDSKAGIRKGKLCEIGDFWSQIQLKN